MNICIYETEHFETAYSLIQLFDQPKNKITILTNQACFAQFEHLLRSELDHYNWIIEEANGTRFRRFRNLYSQLKRQKPGLLYLNTVSNNHFLFAGLLWLLPATRTILTVHDINCLFQPRVSFHIHSWIRYIGKKWLTSQVSIFNVISETMTPYLQKKIRGNKKIYSLPGGIYKGGSRILEIMDHIHLVIPGSIEKKRRNYHDVIKLIEEAEQMKLRLKITLLGGIKDEYGKSILNQISRLRLSSVTVKIYETNEVPQGEFDGQLESSHFLFIPSVIETIVCENIPEVYGITKSSGNIFDAIRHGKPFIVPFGLSVPTNIETSCLLYKDITELVTILNGYFQTPGRYLDIRNKAISNSGNYRVEKIRLKYPELFSAT